jgi:hypothetical protein
MTVVPITLGQVLGCSVEKILSDRGIKTKRTIKGATTWFNFEICPCCGHGTYQCGVSEEAKGGRLMHAIKCFHPHDNPWGVDKPRYADFIAHIGVALPEARSSARVAADSTLDRGVPGACTRRRWR